MSRIKFYSMPHIYRETLQACTASEFYNRPKYANTRAHNHVGRELPFEICFLRCVAIKIAVLLCG